MGYERVIQGVLTEVSDSKSIRRGKESGLISPEVLEVTPIKIRTNDREVGVVFAGFVPRGFIGREIKFVTKYISWSEGKKAWSDELYVFGRKVLDQPYFTQKEHNF